MAIIQSAGSLLAVTQPTLPPTSFTDLEAVRLGGFNPMPMRWGYRNEYGAIYAAQPNIRTCVDFLARNIAQLGYHVFRRVSDIDRVRLYDHPLAQWIRNPNPDTTTYRLFESLIADLALHFNAYWLKIRLTGGRIGLVRIPPQEMRVVGGLLRAGYLWTSAGTITPLETTEIVYFNGYNPLNALMGLSPLETLRPLLLEDAASSRQRQLYWQNASRMEGVIERPRDAPRWSPEQKQSWRTQWQERFAGPASTGQVPVLEDGMTWKQISWSAKESEFINGRKLTREEVAAAYHIPLPMVGILDHATFSNIKEQHKQLYADCLGPWLTMVEEGLALQLLPEAADAADVYGEFNIAEKLKGSFEEQANALRLLVGRPVMTANEGRARLNLPQITDDPSADQLAAQQGGPASVGAPDPLAATERHHQVAAIVRGALARQAARLGKFPVGQRPEVFDHDRCTRELAADLSALLPRAEAWAYAARVSDHTYVLLMEGRDAFASDREVPDVAA
jgi:HK97 family phage portal protein